MRGWRASWMPGGASRAGAAGFRPRTGHGTGGAGGGGGRRLAFVAGRTYPRLLRPGERADFLFFAAASFCWRSVLQGLGVVAGRQAADAAVEAFSHREVIQRIQDCAGPRAPRAIARRVAGGRPDAGGGQRHRLGREADSRCGGGLPSLLPGRPRGLHDDRERRPGDGGLRASAQLDRLHRRRPSLRGGFPGRRSPRDTMWSPWTACLWERARRPSISDWKREFRSRSWFGTRRATRWRARRSGWIILAFLWMRNDRPDGRAGPRIAPRAGGAGVSW